MSTENAQSVGATEGVTMRPFGEQIRWSAKALIGPGDVDFLDVDADDDSRTLPRTTAIMQIVVSLAVLAIAAVVLVAGSSDDGSKAAWGAIGTILGYWLH